jgi:hypothetical protein
MAIVSTTQFDGVLLALGNFVFLGTQLGKERGLSVIPPEQVAAQIQFVDEGNRQFEVTYRDLRFTLEYDAYDSSADTVDGVALLAPLRWAMYFDMSAPPAP